MSSSHGSLIRVDSYHSWLNSLRRWGLFAVAHDRPLTELLAELDVARIKRHVFGADLHAIHDDAHDAFVAALAEARRGTHYRRALQHALAESALEALRSFPANEAVALTTRIFLETSPEYVRMLRNTGRIVGAPFRGLQWLASKLGTLTGLTEPAAARRVEDHVGRKHAHGRQWLCATA